MMGVIARLKAVAIQESYNDFSCEKRNKKIKD
jgi:hypothetical protein